MSVIYPENTEEKKKEKKRKKEKKKLLRIVKTQFC